MNKKLFTFRVEQTLATRAAVWAEDEFDAHERIWDAIHSDDLVLDCENVVDTDVDVLGEMDPKEKDIYYIINPDDIPED